MKKVIILLTLMFVTFTTFAQKDNDSKLVNDETKPTDLIVGKMEPIPFNEMDAKIILVRYSLLPRQAFGKAMTGQGQWNDMKNSFSIDMGQKTGKFFSQKGNDARVRFAENNKVAEFTSFSQLWLLLEEIGYEYVDTYNQYPPQFEAPAAQKGGVIARTVHIFRLKK